LPPRETCAVPAPVSTEPATFAAASEPAAGIAFPAASALTAAGIAESATG
jgi:hypothetical protein